MAATTYPVHVDADLDPGLNRWLWLFKWLLAIPHYVVLAFLWLAFMVLSVVAFFAILFTGHYPRAIFDFNVGVLRWSWRVAYYAYGALATDRYPPFTLAEVPEYPAHLAVDYPEHLSRGLVLVKWWLLAIPHYLVLAFLLGGGVYVGSAAASDQNQGWLWGSGLIGLLVFIAAVVLLFTGRYPQPIYDLVLGLNRWVIRVAAYVGLMTDQYPPFRLDMGGHDPTAPGVVAVPPPAGPTAPAEATATDPSSTTSTAQTPTMQPGTTQPGTMQPGIAQAAAAQPGAGGGSWSAGRVIAVVVGALLALMAGGLLAGGATLGVAGQTLRNDAGFFMTPDQELTAATYAIESEPLDLGSGSSADVAPRAILGDLRLEVTALGDDPVFVGVADTADAEAYLAGVQHSTLVGMEGDTPVPLYRESAGSEPTVLPGDTDIWVASASGTGQQVLEWELESGDWTVVVMNADGSRDIAVDASAGATFPALGWVVLGMLVVGGALLAVAVVVLVLALAGRREQA
jgi:hypothetical protein